MRRNLKKLMAISAVLAALSGGAVTFAQSERPQSESQQGATTDGEPMNMMSMMGRMSEMMERCNDMMARMQPEEAGTAAEGDAG